MLAGAALMKSNVPDSKRNSMLKTPSQTTLKKYGLTELMWHDIADSQDRCCYVCQKVPKSGRLCIDHEHVKGFKKMDNIEKRKYVRGLLCMFCNRFFLARGQSIQKAERIAMYLRRYDEIKSKAD
jgi:hypothetical protein